jgi:hypothetical protein
MSTLSATNERWLAPDCQPKVNEMHTLSSKEWEHLYRTVWRARFAHLSKSERAKLVRICRGKAVFDCMEEARSMLRILQPEGKLSVCAFCCPLCQHFHVADRRVITAYRRVLKNDSSPASSPQSSTSSFRGLLEPESPGSPDGLEITPGLVTLRG